MPLGMLKVNEIEINKTSLVEHAWRQGKGGWLVLTCRRMPGQKPRPWHYGLGTNTAGVLLLSGADCHQHLHLPERRQGSASLADKRINSILHGTCRGIPQSSPTQQDRPTADCQNSVTIWIGFVFSLLNTNM